jgi:hypothetical protein
MKRLIILTFLASLFTIITEAQQVKECYQTVDHMIWVVEQLDEVVESWEKLGFTDIHYMERAELKLDGRNIDIKAASANLSGSKVLWLQPVRERSLLTDFLESYGSGIYAIIHGTDSKSDIKEEVERLKKRRVDVNCEFEFKSSYQSVSYCIMQTRDDGTYNMGFVHENESEKLFDDLPGDNKYNLQFSQYAFATTQPKEVSKYWSRIGLPKLAITHGSVHDKEYYGNPAGFDMKLGWQRHGDIVYEWCIPLKSPNVYEDHIRKKGEGVHHLGFQVDNMNQTLNNLIEKGFIVSQAGGWGNKGKPGSGKFAYIDPKPLGGVAVELLWNQK